MLVFLACLMEEHQGTTDLLAMLQLLEGIPTVQKRPCQRPPQSDESGEQMRGQRLPALASTARKVQVASRCLILTTATTARTWLA